MKKFELTVEGIDSGEAKRTAESALVKVDGVYSAMVSRKEGTASITARNRVEPDDVLAAASDAGFEAELTSSETVELTGSESEESESEEE